MPNSRKKSKRKVCQYFEPFEIKSLKQLAAINGTNLTGFMRMIAAGKPFKTLADVDEETRAALNRADWGNGEDKTI